MIYRISSVSVLPGFRLLVSFDDGKRVIYDVREDFSLPGYDTLRTMPGLFSSVQLDPSRTCVYWSDDIDLPSDILREYGVEASETAAVNT